MDLTMYFQKIRDEQQKMADEFPVVVSCETADGGKAGLLTETTKRVAAGLIVEGKATLAEAAVAEAFRQKKAAAKEQADADARAAKMGLVLDPVTRQVVGMSVGKE